MVRSVSPPRFLENRLKRLERTLPPEVPTAVFGTCPVPEPFTREDIKRWLAEGLADISFGGRAIVYHGGCRKMTQEQWMAKFGRNRQS